MPQIFFRINLQDKKGRDLAQDTHPYNAIWHNMNPVRVKGFFE
jgi:hypothetical protein